MGALASALDFIFPPRCPGCARRAAVVAFCPACAATIAPVREPLCPICGDCFSGSGPDHCCSRCLLKPPAYRRARACALYRSDNPGPLVAALHRLKYGRDVTLGAPLARHLSEHCPLPVDHDLLVPVPLDLARLRWRGFNQAVLLGRALARNRGRRFHPMALRRIRPTAIQVGLGEEERRRNLAGAFAVRDRAAVRGRSVLLVDDVMTTGATVAECAAALRKAGARRIDVVVLARATDFVPPPRPEEPPPAD